MRDKHILVTTNHEKSAEVIVGCLPTEGLNNNEHWKEREVVKMKKAENKQKLGKMQRDKTESKEYASAQSQSLGEALDQWRHYPIMSRVVERNNLRRACDRVRRNGGSPGVDGMTVEEVESHIFNYYVPLCKKLFEGTYRPQPVKRVEIPKPNGGVRKLGIPVVRDRVIQQAIKQVIEPSIDKTFSPYSYGFRPNRNAHQARKQCAKYYEEGYRYVVDCDLKQYFDTINHDKLMYLLKQHLDDKSILRLINRFLQAGVIELNGNFQKTGKGAPQGGVLSPLLSNIYLHELDKELTKRGHRFVRYADDFVIFTKSKRAGERILQSISRFLSKELKLVVNTEKSKVGSPYRLKFLSCLIMKANGGCRYRPTKEAVKQFKAKLRQVTSRKTPKTFQMLVKEINQVARGWIQYHGRGYIKGTIRAIESWLHRRIRQLILKRWKRPRTKIKELMKRGLTLDESKRIAYSRKKYWRLSCTWEVHQAIPTEKLYQWGLLNMTQLAEQVYLHY